MSRVVTTVIDDTIDIDALERAWQGPDHTPEPSVSMINSATLTVTRNGAGDFQDRQVFLSVDGELWGKVKYGWRSTRCPASTCD